MKHFCVVFAILITCIVIETGALHAQIPRTLFYQGALTDASTGKPWSNGAYQFTFRLYDVPNGGSPIWAEQRSLQVTNGLFSTVLSETTPFGANVKFDRPYWLGIQVGNEPELTPRIALTSVGYSFSSLRADTASVAMVSLPSASDTTWRASDGNVGIGTMAPKYQLHIDGTEPVLALTDGTSSSSAAIRGNEGIWLFGYAGTPGSEDVSIGSQHGTADARIVTMAAGGFPRIKVLANGNVGIGALNPTTKLEVDGRIKTSVLEITGGSDLAEPFEILHDEKLPAGALVVIDKDHPGKLKQAIEPYDKRVAGVISGAGGVNPGLTLSQEGVLDGGQHVALSGKVYALATAANGPIEPGDLLMTSQIPGHAMKATNKDRSFGTVIGKAMSSPEKREGLVLVFVNLQ